MYGGNGFTRRNGATGDERRRLHVRDDVKMSTPVTALRAVYIEREFNPQASDAYGKGLWIGLSLDV